MEKNKIITIIGILSFVVISFSAKNVGDTNKSGGAPLSQTGAPDIFTLEESTCAAGCHNQWVLNSGPGTLTVELVNGGTEFMPGSNNEIRIRIDQSGLGDRFGFQAVVIKEYSDQVKTQIGSIELRDPVRTQIIVAPGSAGNIAGRQYLTHTFDGTVESEVGASEWNFNWVAPDTITGNIGIYVAALASNADGDMAGDYVYQKELILTATPASVQPASTLDLFKVYPSHVESTLNVDVKDKKIRSIKIYNVAGQELMAFKLNQGNNKLQLSSSIKSEICFYKLSTSKGEIAGQGKFFKL